MAQIAVFPLPWQPPQGWEAQMVPRQLGGLQEQRGEVLRNVGRITRGLTNKQASRDICLHWDSESINVTNLPSILG